MCVGAICVHVCMSGGSSPWKRTLPYLEVHSLLAAAHHSRSSHSKAQYKVIGKTHIITTKINTNTLVQYCVHL